MKFSWFAMTALAVSLGVCGAWANKAYSAPASAAAISQDRDHDWDAPPAEFREIQRQGFHDGVEGARKDFDHHRRPDVNNRDEFKHPHVPHDQREDYREGFRRGYESAMSHLMSEHGHM